MGKRKGLSLLGVISGSILVVTVGLIGWIVVPKIIDDKIKDETRLTNEDTREKWENISIPIALRFYIYNCTNPRGYLTGEKLHFEERGPYVYNEVRSKDVEFSGDLSNVSYRQTIFYHFDEEASIGSEDDLFNIPNVPLITLAHVGYGTYPDSQLGQLQLLLTLLVRIANEGLFQENVPVRELLFQGWKINSRYSIIPAFAEGLFGFYQHKNGSNDGQYVVRTGDENHEEFGQISTWEGKRELEYWYTEGLDRDSSQHFCNKINGSDGSLFPPFIKKDSTLRMFNTDVCRSIWVTFDSETTYRSIPGYRFTIPDEMFEHPDLNENNRCFCPAQSPRLASQCGKSIIRIFPCKQGAPIVTSNPRFLGGGEELFQPIEMGPAVRQELETFIEVEPRSGVLLRASKKIQINVEVQNLPLILFRDLDFSNFTQSPSIFLPVFWAEELAQLDESSASDLYDKLVRPTRAVQIARWVVITMSALLTFVSAVFLISALKK